MTATLLGVRGYLARKATPFRQIDLVQVTSTGKALTAAISPTPDLLQNLEKKVATRGRGQKWLPSITTEGEEVEVAVTIVALEGPGHGDRLGKGR